MLGPKFLINEWQHSSPVKFYFGSGSISNLRKIPGVFGKRCLIVTGPNISKSNEFKVCSKILDDESCVYDIYKGVNSEPTTEHVNEITKIFNSGQYDFLIGIGGGSSLDAAKAAAVTTLQGGDLEDYFSLKRQIGDASTPLVLIPTTSGTGAELSQGAIISWTQKKVKTGLRGAAVFANVSIIDPDLTMSVPYSVVKVSGFDVFTHAVETFISKKATPLTSIYSLMAIENVIASLPKLLKDPDDKSARVTMSFCSMMMGSNLSNSSTCLPHRLQYPLGELTKTPHALGLAALYPSWVQITYAESEQKFLSVTQKISTGLTRANIEHDKSGDILSLLNAFMIAIDLQPKLSDFGITAEICKIMSQQVSGSLNNDPWWIDGSDLSQFYLRSL